jgi:hypothetical protein
VSTIRDSIVNKVQAAFDAANVNVKVLGKTGDAVPADESFMRVFVGDGPHGNFNTTNNGVAGVTWADLFNQDAHDPSGTNTHQTHQETPLIFVDNIFRTSNGLFTSGNGAAVALSDTGSGMITATHAENAIANTIAHEIGHSLGLLHLDDGLNHLIMNSGASPNELRTLQSFSATGQQLEGYGSGVLQNDVARLAFAVGSDSDPQLINREAPNQAVLQSRERVAFKASASIAAGTTVARAILGIVPNGDEHIVPELIDLGAGDLSALLDKELMVRPDDKMFLAASTNGNSFDVFSVIKGFSGDIGAIDLSNGLLLLTEQSIRGEVADAGGQPQDDSLNVFRIVGGNPVLLGELGTSAPLALAGDYNGNGSVGPEDYLVWKSNFGSTTQLAADGNADGLVNAADYTVWRDGLSAGSGGSASVPEPHAILISVLGLTIVGRMSRGQRA